MGVQDSAESARRWERQLATEGSGCVGVAK